MKKVDDLMESAHELKERGLKSGEIADELNVSRETANWLLTHSSTGTDEGDEAPGDIHLDWSAVGSSSRRLSLVAEAMKELIAEDLNEEPDAVVGIAKAGVPLATLVAEKFDARLAEYTPRKQKWGEDDYDELSGSFSRNFAGVDGARCVVVDDVVTTGRTMTEAVRFVEENGGTPVSAAVLANKSGKTSIDGVEVNSLVGVVRVE
ncbi:orotate phosphoribosyltransferase-like protein [Haladaptatus sp. F3-133]|jgi:orotate phosphoribosyltransferase|uniref:Transcriptional regulator GfcR n=1 Tax=Halorutilus salinus TaxID=2487751 RepID=A0A9Q4C6C7_9EURY|nr:orotate phosphoribosyltransferase-like protein [Halorutilus salinus]MCX2819917.1 orotate phosphoribosyltransferase-like protein [Halorutilus salinus]